ncbi:MAG: MaoC family dehydratase, partial [Gammaproteobacteria bacterium]|nr:MaoC family dehydratase [Gammaproteobacteria bacterium]
MTDERNVVGAWDVGTTLPSWQVEAYNDAVDSGNAIHADDTAQRYGFGGGLVPGVTTYGYLLHPVVTVLGVDFLARGASSVRLRRPIYEGEIVTVTATVSACVDGVTGFELEARNPAGEVCALGTAHYPAPASAASNPPDRAPLPSPRVPATPEALAALGTLGSFECAQTAAEAQAFVAAAGDADSACYGDVLHPAWLLRQANYVVDRSIALGPWIHTASEVVHLGHARIGETLEVRAAVVDLSTHKGNDYA